MMTFQRSLLGWRGRRKSFPGASSFTDDMKVEGAAVMHARVLGALSWLWSGTKIADGEGDHALNILSEDPEAPLTIRQMNVDLCSAKQKAVLLFTTLVLAALYAYVWSWWVALHAGAPWGFGDVLLSVMLAVDCHQALVPLFYGVTAQQIDPRVPPQRLRVAMITTKVPSEPFELVRDTLEAMLRQDYPYPYDVWLADEAPTDEVKAWCAQHSVRLSTRQGVKEYHRDAWPRRAKCKEGNLAFFYDHWGYRDYDAVAQFDADHVPSPTYLSATLPAFRDPSVAYVAAPSLDCIGEDKHWTVRGRLHREARFHGFGQASCYPYVMPMCIGSHYTVRTAHLQSVGGIGPELDEDYSTTYLLTSKGYEGVYSLASVAAGKGPSDFAASMRQEYQWARSLTIILLQYTAPFFNRKLDATKTYRVLRLSTHYLSVAIYFFLSMGIVCTAAASQHRWRFRWMNVLLNFLVPQAVALMFAYWLRAQHWLRPVCAPVLSWEALVHGTCMPLWIVRGVLDALFAHFTGIETTIEVTPKSRDGAPKVLAPRSVMPLCLVATLCFCMMWLLSPEFVVLPFLVGICHAAAAFVVVAMHFREHHRQSVPWRNLAVHVLQLGATASALAAVVVKFGGGSDIRAWAAVLSQGMGLDWHEDIAVLKVLASAVIVYQCGLWAIVRQGGGDTSVYARELQRLRYPKTGM